MDLRLANLAACATLTHPFDDAPLRARESGSSFGGRNLDDYRISVNRHQG